MTRFGLVTSFVSGLEGLILFVCRRCWMATKDDLMLALYQVIDPELHRDIVTLKMVKDVEVVDGVA